MSGGHWDYLQFRLDEAADMHMPAACLQVLGQVEHELDWGHSGDTCLPCARLRVIAGLETFFDGGAADARAAIAVLRDRQQVTTICDECLERFVSREGLIGDHRPRVEEAQRELDRRSP